MPMNLNEYAQYLQREGQPSLDQRTGIARPSMTSLIDPNNGLLRGTYRLNNPGDTKLNVNEDALSELRSRGLSKGPSSYANILNQQQGLEEQNALGKTGQSVASANSSAFSNLAARGGLSSGGRERLAMAGARDASAGSQGVMRQGMLDRLGISASDEAQKLGILQNLPGQELALGQAKNTNDIQNRDFQTNIDKLNITGALNEVGRNDAAKLEEYKQKMAAYGAEKTADAQANAGKK